MIVFDTATLREFVRMGSHALDGLDVQALHDPQPGAPVADGPT